MQGILLRKYEEEKIKITCRELLNITVKLTITIKSTSLFHYFNFSSSFLVGSVYKNMYLKLYFVNNKTGICALNIKVLVR